MGHKICLFPDIETCKYFKNACGTRRRTWNWAVEEWRRQFAAGENPTGRKLRAQFNAVKYVLFPWIEEIHRDAHSQPFIDLQRAWDLYFKGKKNGTKVGAPQFKKKGDGSDSFYVSNDRFRLEGDIIVLPIVGAVKMAEELRWEGKLLNATVSHEAGNWFVSIQVAVVSEQFYQKRNADGVNGVDLNSKNTVQLSDGTVYESPRPLQKYLSRIQQLQKIIAHKTEFATREWKKQHNLDPKAKLPKGTVPISKSCQRCIDELAKLHARVRNIRSDFNHKTTTEICRNNHTVVIEDLNVAGMLTNRYLARCLSDVSFGEIRRQLEYKAVRYGTTIIVADQWYPSSKLCSSCGHKNSDLELKDRKWTCPNCGVEHDRDLNAAINLKKLALTNSVSVVSPSAQSISTTEDLTLDSS
jgi:putative transposase